MHGVQDLSVVSDVQTCQKLQADEGLATSEAHFKFQFLFSLQVALEPLWQSLCNPFFEGALK